MNQEKQIEEMTKDVYEAPMFAPTYWQTCNQIAMHLYNKGYHKQSEGKWEIVIGSNSKEKMVCTNCRHQQDLASTFVYCPNCGAKMKGD